MILHSSRTWTRTEKTRTENDTERGLVLSSRHSIDLKMNFYLLLFLSSFLFSLLSFFLFSLSFSCSFHSLFPFLFLSSEDSHTSLLTILLSLLYFPFFGFNRISCSVKSIILLLLSHSLSSSFPFPLASSFSWILLGSPNVPCVTSGWDVFGQDGDKDKHRRMFGRMRKESKRINGRKIHFFLFSPFWKGCELGLKGETKWEKCRGRRREEVKWCFWIVLRWKERWRERGRDSEMNRRMNEQEERERKLLEYSFVPLASLFLLSVLLSSCICW